MNRKSKLLASFSSLTFAVLLGGAFAMPEKGNMFCQCDPNIAFDHTLPLSHPINKCAASMSDGVSWASWFSGDSSSYQFHFIDLLELLSRTKDYTHSTKTKPAKTQSTEAE